MKIFFWFLFSLTSVGAVGYMAYLLVLDSLSSEFSVNRYGSYEKRPVGPDPLLVKASAKLWAFGFALVAFSVFSGFTACLVINGGL